MKNEYWENAKGVCWMIWYDVEWYDVEWYDVEWYDVE
jgi:hypothetical protein